MDRAEQNRRTGLSMVELLCVIAIIAILMALYLPAIAKAFTRTVKFLKGMSGLMMVGLLYFLV